MIMKSALVTIGLPVYNGAIFMEKALDSLLAQDYENIEIVISDNASNDQTLKICREYASFDNRIRIWQQPTNVGIWANFETVLKLAHGKYFMWAAVDDYWSPDFISALVHELENNSGAGVAMSAVECKPENNQNAESYIINFTGKNNPNRLGYLGMANQLTSFIKYNYFIYGVFKTRLLQKAFPSMPEIPSSDRWLLLLIALASRFRYIGVPLHTRTIRDAALHQRYPDDDYSLRRKIFDQKWFDFEPIPVVAKMIYKSPIIPFRRKLYIPVIVLHIFYYRLILGILRMTKSLILRYCPRCIQKRLIKGVN